ncbi:MAG: type II toxin-antitoxin system PemK/MazF family toxin [Pseudomonadota bacterium]
MKQGAIWRINLDPTIGAEIKKTRPCVILNSNKVGKLPLKVIAPLTDLKEHYRLVPWMVVVEPTPENGLEKASVIDLFQVRSVSHQRLCEKIGVIEDELLERCKRALNVVFE